MFYLHTNDNAENFKLIKSQHKKKDVYYEVISPKKNTIIGSPLILKKWLLWVEKENANFKIYVRNIKNKQTREIKLYNDEVKQVSCSYFEKNLNSNFVYISYSSPKSTYKTLHNLELINTKW